MCVNAEVHLFMCACACVCVGCMCAYMVCRCNELKVHIIMCLLVSQVGIQCMCATYVSLYMQTGRAY